MKQEDKQLLFKDLCARLPYKKLIVDYAYNAYDVRKGNHVKHGSNYILDCYLLDIFISPRQNEEGEYIKPYLRPLSSMTEEEAREIAILHYYDDAEILSVKVTENHIEIILDDGVCSMITEIILYDDIVSSIKCFDYLNKKMFDLRGLIPKGLAIEVTKDNNPYYKI